MSLNFTSDNSHLSELNEHTDLVLASRAGKTAASIAIRCNDLLADPVAKYLLASRATNTMKAYVSDLAAFINWGGSIPSSPETVARYLAERADHQKPATLSRHLASIAVAHRAKGLASPAAHELVRAVLKGIRRIKGTAQREAKPLLRDDLLTVLDAMGDNLKDTRDRSLLLLGFAGGFRRSELVGLNFEDLAFVQHGMIITLRHSKTDQEGKGRKIGIPFGRTKHCPVKTTEHWLRRAGISQGPIFRPVAKGGRVTASRLSGEAVCCIIRDRLTHTGFNPEGFSGHSLRSGFATSAAQADAPSWRIRQQTGHANDMMLSRYVRDGQLFVGNAASTVL